MGRTADIDPPRVIGLFAQWVRGTGEEQRKLRCAELLNTPVGERRQERILSGGTLGLGCHSAGKKEEVELAIRISGGDVRDRAD